MKYVDLGELKNKFGLILMRLHRDAKISASIINQKMLFEPFFDFLERNNVDEILNKDIENISRNIFGGGIIFYNTSAEKDEFYWAGIQYINISINLNIPLKQVVLLCPLEEMLAHYVVYHEMNDIELVKEFKENENKRSILKALRKEKGYSYRELSVLTSINKNAIVYYERDNKNLFNASYKNVTSIIKTLSVSDSFFKECSDFIPFTQNFYGIHELKNQVIKTIEEYLDKDSKTDIIKKGIISDIEDYYFTTNPFEPEKNKLLVKKYAIVVYLNRDIIVSMFKRKIIVEVLSNETPLLIKKSITSALKTYNGFTLLF